MSQLVFDIETRGFEDKDLDPVILESLLKHAATDEEKEGVVERTGLWPVSGEIVAIGMLNPETNLGKVCFSAPQGNLKDYEKAGVQYLVKNEKEMLEVFWQDVKHYNQLITFNGRRFDCPFIIFRSIYHGLKPSRNLMPNRFYTKEHLDLMDQLGFYGSFRNFSLEVMCQFLGIKNPKDEGVSGLVINELYKKGEYQKIAEYCMRDVVATQELHDKVKDFIF
ncbi:hypothetical protein A3J77_01220 [Candidatus Wolfebacteria bacterium RBG_13_41_7]|uniref:Predicted 3'-5' exonuclease PolB-like domain-containing protein n=1 Tax=Candidatus Wolfebacteria bacterium RBG_13_41_7 TaxID=1802554 RepID=A0A1F8DLK4_9BACT|nr:MAG: hypothetical protein A3J77_01220 [Candidatus Wolfebacteria bacterium RBG_13_41_7]